MKTYTIEITDEEDIVLRSWLEDPQQWLEDAFNNKIRKRIDASIEEETNFNPKKMAHDDKLTELSKIALPTKAEREGRDIEEE